ncbi:BQ5605_C002g01590 [Microbotryum silenes-dioicae]|uniref:BQ5605_C002g01590 protein n=1 Tax=Microbotryum silenes-dioicae TaxID=796604 RepID=A0A2X0M3K8_9BASI|nr:BQ5605_C002g01590 [Microbotryum silenes-dioicae]
MSTHQVDPTLPRIPNDAIDYKLLQIPLDQDAPGAGPDDRVLLQDRIDQMQQIDTRVEVGLRAFLDETFPNVR